MLKFNFKISLYFLIQLLYFVIYEGCSWSGVPGSRENCAMYIITINTIEIYQTILLDII